MVAIYTERSLTFRTQTTGPTEVQTGQPSKEKLDGDLPHHSSKDVNLLDESARKGDIGHHELAWLHSKPLDPVLGVRVFTDADEWNWVDRSSPVLHIELRRWADILLVAPLSANTLAKISNGICDNLLVDGFSKTDMRHESLGVHNDTWPSDSQKADTISTGDEHSNVEPSIHEHAAGHSEATTGNESDRTCRENSSMWRQRGWGHGNNQHHHTKCHRYPSKPIRTSKMMRSLCS